MNQSGTLTVARVAVDSVHVSATDGLTAFDQTLNVDPQGTVAQSSPASPFIDLLDYVAAILAAAPPNVQKDAQWSVNVSALSPVQTAGTGMEGGSQYTPRHQPKNTNINLSLTTKLVSVSGDVLTFHGEGIMKQEMETIAGMTGQDIATTIDFKLKSGQLQSCTRTTQTIQVMGAQHTPMITIVTSLTAK
jgi:hypothetical protein